jgi:cystathionine gamma-synthase
LPAQALGWVDEKTRAIVPPIHTSTTFIRRSRQSVPLRARLRARPEPDLRPAEAVLTALEGGSRLAALRIRHGSGHGCFPGSGAGDHVLVHRR